MINVNRTANAPVAAVPQRRNSPAQTPTDSAQLSGGESRSLGWKMWAAAGLALAGASLSGCSPEKPASPPTEQVQTPTAPAKPYTGVRHDKMKSDLTPLLQNTMTVDELPAGAPHLTALGVDPQQSTKIYLDPTTMKEDSDHPGTLVPDGGSFLLCTNTSATTGLCSGAIPDQIQHSVLSCVYKDENDGQKYRVSQKSMQDYHTPPMQRNVCGGHNLVYNSETMGYMPNQTDKSGHTLYLNPANIIHMEKIN